MISLEISVLGMLVGLVVFLVITILILHKELYYTQNKLKILRRYHGGDGTITRDDVIKALSKED